MEKRLMLSQSDLMRLRVLIRNEHAIGLIDREELLDLQDEIDNAVIIDTQDLLDDLVTLDARVLVRDLETDMCTVHTLVCRRQADLSQGELSVLAPLGVALLGYCAGDEIEWHMPGGRKELRIEAVMQPTNSIFRPLSAPSAELSA
jgi:regulator of nucleoside diphosphate kinase